jgi:hypothetical protein
MSGGIVRSAGGFPKRRAAGGRDPEYDTGITGSLKIAHVAEAPGLDAEIHACGPAHRHLMAALRNTNY